MKTIGIIGAGQLGQILGYAGKHLDLDFVFLDPSDNPPAVSAGAVLKYDFDNPEGLEKLASISDVITYEFENVPVAALQKLDSAISVYPPAEALRLAQDRLDEKTLFQFVIHLKGSNNKISHLEYHYETALCIVTSHFHRFFAKHLAFFQKHLSHLCFG